MKSIDFQIIICFPIIKGMHDQNNSHYIIIIMSTISLVLYFSKNVEYIAQCGVVPY